MEAWQVGYNRVGGPEDEQIADLNRWGKSHGLDLASREWDIHLDSSSAGVRMR